MHQEQETLMQAGSQNIALLKSSSAVTETVPGCSTSVKDTATTLT